jgi:hypothetical protein
MQYRLIRLVNVVMERAGRGDYHGSYELLAATNCSSVIRPST